MSQNTSIEWTDASWNPIRGTKGRHHCVRISEGCKHCYAATMNHRFGGPDYVVGADTPRFDEEALLQPLKWRKPRRIFVCSMTDLFLDEHTDEMIDRVFAVMALAPNHTFQVLTKRSKRMAEYVGGRMVTEGIEVAMIGILRSFPAFEPKAKIWPLPNVWLGVSAENQARADERIPDLLATPAAVRFVSAEPLLGPIDLRDYFGFNVDPIGIDWVIVGGESGPGARPCDVSWIRSIKDHCVYVSVPVFVKQLGARPYVCLGSHDRAASAGPGPSPNCGGAAGYGCSPHVLKDKKGGDPSEWPADLRVRQMPEVTR